MPSRSSPPRYRSSDSHAGTESTRLWSPPGSPVSSAPAPPTYGASGGSYYGGHASSTPKSSRPHPLLAAAIALLLIGSGFGIALITRPYAPCPTDAEVAAVIHNLNQALEAAGSEIQYLARTANRLENETTELRLNLSTTEQKADELSALLTATRRKVDDLQQHSNELDRTISGLRLALDTEKQKVSRLDVALGAARLRIQYLESDNSELKNTADSLRSEIREVKEEAQAQLARHFVRWVQRLGIGGNSWVNSDDTPFWTFGYSSLEPPSPTLEVVPVQGTFDQSSSYTFRAGYDGTPFDSRIVGFKVDALGAPGHNGRWVRRISGEAFEGKEITFVAEGGSYAATVFCVMEKRMTGEKTDSKPRPLS